MYHSLFNFIIFLPLSYIIFFWFFFCLWLQRHWVHLQYGMIQSISAASYVHLQLMYTGSSGLIMNVEQSHLWLFIVKQAPLPSENLHDSGRNVRRRGDVLKFNSSWVWSCQPTSFLFVWLCCYSNRQLNEPHWKMYEEMSHSISLTKPYITFTKSFTSPFLQ